MHVPGCKRRRIRIGNVRPQRTVVLVFEACLPGNSTPLARSPRTVMEGLYCAASAMTSECGHRGRVRALY